MDVSEQYRKMCEKATEIQNVFPNIMGSGDYVYSKQKNRSVILYFNIHHGVPPEHYTNRKLGVVWLPRQDQLQWILGDGFHKCEEYWFPEVYINKFCGWINTTGGPKPFLQLEYKGKFTSLEQMWLAFVMKEEYNKMWNGVEWEKTAPDK